MVFIPDHGDQVIGTWFNRRGIKGVQDIPGIRENGCICGMGAFEQN